MKKVLRYFLFYKLYGVLCQFSDTEGRTTLKNFGPFPDDIYPVGRLDADSEGLVFLTNDGALKHFLLEPKFDHSRTYLVQVEHVPTEESLERLRQGVIIEGRKTKSADVRLLTEDPDLPPRPVPIRYRNNVPTAWLEITLREGKNRQVRKMTAAVNHPTLRLVRIAIESFTLQGLKPGEYREISPAEIQKRFGDRFPSH